jgi:hypothetical protein
VFIIHLYISTIIQIDIDDIIPKAEQDIPQEGSRQNNLRYLAYSAYPTTTTECPLFELGI